MRNPPLSILLIAVAFGLVGCGSPAPYLGLDEDELYQYAVERFEREKWDDAIEALERLLLAFPTSQRVIEARMYLARAFFEKEEYISAASEFTRFLERYPGHDLAPDAALGRCRAYADLSPRPERDQTYTQQALASCEDVATAYPFTEAAEQARIVQQEMRDKLARKLWLNGDFYFRRKLYDSAIIYFEDVIEEYPDTPSAPEALLKLYEAYTRIGWEREASEARQRLLDRYPESPAAFSVGAAS